MDIIEQIGQSRDLPSPGDGLLRIIQELVPGKQITMAHIIAGPDG